MTALPRAGDPDVLFIVDVHCWLYRFHATMRGRAAHGFIDFISRVLREQRPAYFAACTDMPWPTFRHQLAPDTYKAQRPAPDPLIHERIRWAREMLEDLHGITTFGAKGYEADDLIAALTKRAVADGLRVVLLALDKDLLQLVDGERVFMWDGKKQVWGSPEVFKSFGIRPDQLRDYLTIVGDSADNISGIKGAGPKTAVELLAAFGTLDHALDAADGKGVERHPELFKKRPGYRALLQQSHGDVELSRKLVSLAYDAPLAYDRTTLAMGEL